MPGIGTQPIAGKPIRGKFVGLPDGTRRFAWLCGKSLCDTNVLKERKFVDPHPEEFPVLPVVLQGRYIGTNPATGLPRYAVATECRPQPGTDPVAFVLTDVWAFPFGVTKVIKFFFLLGNFPIAVQCLGGTDGCPYVYLNWGGGRSWTGSYGTASGTPLTVTLTLTDVQDPDRPLADGWPTVRKWEVTFGGCVSPAVTRHVHVGCYWPLTGGGQLGGPIPTSCCPLQDSPPAPDVAFAVRGFTNRMLPSRFVDLPGGVEKYYTSTCCPPEAGCEVTNCCGCDVTVFQWTLNVAGVANGPGPPFPGTACPCHNGSYTLTLSNEAFPECTWSSGPGACPPANVPPDGVMWRLRCDVASGKYLLTTQDTPGGGGTATYSKAIADWDCLGSNVMTLDGPPPAICGNWPASVTVSPVP